METKITSKTEEYSPLPGVRLGFSRKLRLMQCSRMPDDIALRELSEQDIEKLKLPNDAEFSNLEVPHD